MELELPEYRVAQQVRAVAPAGAMLAPERIAGAMVLSSADYPQLAIRSEAELYWGYLEKNLKQMTARVQSALFMDGQIQDKLSYLESELRTEAPRIQTLVMRTTVYHRADVRVLIDTYGYTNVGTSGPYSILTRQQP